MIRSQPVPVPCQCNLQVGSRRYRYWSLPAAEKMLGDLSRLPFVLKIVLENLLRHQQDAPYPLAQLQTLAAWLQPGEESRDIDFRPARILMQDFTGVPALVDLAAMRDAMVEAGADPAMIRPQVPVDLVIDHSVSVERAGDDMAFDENVRLEMQRNKERYAFLRWGQAAFDNVRLVPPGTGICHQINLEYLGQVVRTQPLAQGGWLAFPDSLVGMDSHTTMINALGILGWGVGGIEAEAVMLGQPVSLMLPRVIGVHLSGQLPPGTTATDLVLRITERLRGYGVVDCFVEFYGSGLQSLSLPDRATLANMAPEYGATCAIFPIDRETLNYLARTGREPQQVALVEAYARAQGLWHSPHTLPAFYSDSVHLELDSVTPCVAGPRRPQDRVELADVSAVFRRSVSHQGEENGVATQSWSVPGKPWLLQEGAVVIAAITSCTNTSNPALMMTAGLLARNARRRGLQVPPWVKTSLAPGSRVVSDYLKAAGLQADLDYLGFHLVGYGCTTCIGNSGPLDPAIASVIDFRQLKVCAVLSGNRNFDGRIHPLVSASFLCSPPLVVAYALAGRVDLDLTRAPLGEDADGQPVYLHELWPSPAEVADTVTTHLHTDAFRQRYADLFTEPPGWQSQAVCTSQCYPWYSHSSYIRRPGFFDGFSQTPPTLQDIDQARILAILGDGVTTDHISPAGNIAVDSPAGAYLQSVGVTPADFNSYGSRRGNFEVMVRGAFANPRLQNLMTPHQPGGTTRLAPSHACVSIFAAARHFGQLGTPLVVFAGAEYGMGSSRDWAAKGAYLLGIRVVIAQSFERIHRTNLIGMGILPLELEEGTQLNSLELSGDEQVSIRGLAFLTEAGVVDVMIQPETGPAWTLRTRCCIHTHDELRSFRHGGILQYCLRERIQTAHSLG